MAKSPDQRVLDLTSEHDRNMKIWSAKAEMVKTPAEFQVLVSKRPKTQAYGDEILKLINPYLDKDWAVPGMAWLIRNHPALTIKKLQPDGSVLEIDRELTFLNHFEKYHLSSSHAGVFTVSTMFSTNNNAEVQAKHLSIAKKVYTTHANKNPKILGAAALACGHFSPVIEGDLVREQEVRNYYKSAAGHAMDVVVGNTTVGEILAEKSYIKMRLSAGSPVPFIEGYDAVGNEHKLMDYKGKAYVLFFWSQSMPEFDVFKQQVNSIKQKSKMKGLEIIGVTKDDVQSVRTLIGDADILWRNFIDVNENIGKTFRVSQVPFCYIVSASGHIRYRGLFGGPLFGSVLTEELSKNNLSTQQ